MKIEHLKILTILALIFIPLVSVTTFVPGSVSATLAPGQSVLESENVTTDPTPLSKADVLFSFDCTGSMGSQIALTQAGAKQTMDNVSKQVPEVQFGVTSHRDYPHSYNSFGYSNQYGGAGDYPYALNQR